jgi:signal transduction histidine kinase
MAELAARESAPTQPREGRGFPLSTGELAAIVLFWLFLALLTAASRTIDPRGPELQPSLVTGLVTLSFFEYALWATLSIPIIWLSSYLSVDDSRRTRRVLLLIALGVVVAIAVDVAVAVARTHILPLPPFRGGRGFGRRPMLGVLGRVAHLEFLDDLMVYFAVLGAGVARGYFLRLQQHREESARLAAQAAELQAQLAQAQLSVLRTQLDPHFLFNTLHAISALVERDPRGVRRMIARLSELLRRSLEGMREQEVPVAEELELLGRYIDIMQVRFQGRIVVDVGTEGDVEDALVPTFVLQPLVENAIEHGASKVSGGGRVTIRIRRSGENLVLTVWNDGPPIGDAEAAGGVGLANTRARVRALYGDRYGVSLREADGGTLAEVVVPFHVESANGAEAMAATASPERAR